MAVRFGELARLRFALSQGELEGALAEQTRRRARGERRRLGEILAGSGRLKPEQVRRLLTEQGKNLLVCAACGWRATVSLWRPGLSCRCSRCRGVLEPDRGEDLSSAADASAMSLAVSMTAETLLLGGPPAGPPAPEAAPAPVPVPGGRYVRVVEIAEGGMGKVYLVQDRELGRNVVMKVLQEDRRDAESVGRFLREAHITARLEHPNIVPVYDQSMDESGRPYFTMKMVRGVDLGEIIAARRKGEVEYSLIRILQILQSICDAVGYAHEQGILHRDLKPENIMHGDYGEVFVMDWGLAREIGKPEDRREGARALPVPGDRRVAGRTQDGMILGTPAYMSPEQARGEPLTARSDIYSLGAILYEIFTREPPYAGRTPQEILDRIAAAPPRAPREIDPQIPPPLEAICLKAMGRRPEDRYATAVEMSEEIQRFIEGQAVLAERLSWWGLMARRLQRRMRSAIVGGTALLLLGGLLALAHVRLRDLAEQARGMEAQEAERRDRQASEREREPRVRALRDEAASVASLPAALELLSEAEALDPRSADTAILRGRLLASAGRHEEAEADFTRALASRPGDAAALRARAASRRTLGNLPGARADADAAPPTRAEREWKAGEAALARSDAKGALAAFEAGLALLPSDTRGRRGRADALLRLGRGADAVADLRSCSEASPGDLPLRLSLASARLGSGDAAGALADYEAVAAADPSRTAEIRGAVFAFLSSAPPGAALKTFTGWLDRHPAPEGEERLVPEAVQRLMRRTPPALEQALALATRMVERFPGTPEPLAMRIQLRRAGGSGEEALADCERLLEATKGEAQAHYLKASVLLEMRRGIDALEALSRCEAALGDKGGDRERRAIADLKKEIQNSLKAGR